VLLVEPAQATQHRAPEQQLVPAQRVLGLPHTVHVPVLVFQGPQAQVLALAQLPAV
jgi:hypothetical protein